jgi:hypothetical protein
MHRLPREKGYWPNRQPLTTAHFATISLAKVEFVIHLVTTGLGEDMRID